MAKILFAVLVLWLAFSVAHGMPVKVLMHLHCSDIPGDDGRKTLAFLAQKAVGEGYDAIIITPHDSGKDNSFEINNLIRKLPEKCRHLAIIAGKELNESGVHILQFGGTMVWAHPGYPIWNAIPNKQCAFYEAFNARVAKTAKTNLFLIPPNASAMKPLAGEDWHGDCDEPFHTAIVAEAENKSEAAIVTALAKGGYSLFIDGVNIAGNAAYLAEELA